MDLDAQRAQTLTHARSIIDKAKADNRDLTDTEAGQVEDDLAQVKTLDKQLKGRAMVNAVKNLGGDFQDDERPKPSVFTADSKAGIVMAIRTKSPYRADVNMKAALTSGTLLPPSGSFVQEGLHPNSQFPLASLFANEPADGPVQRYYRATAGTAAIVAEGAPKPDAGIAFTAVDLTLSKIAGLAGYTDEMEADASFLVGQLEQELIAAVVAAENKLCLDTFAATSGVLTGSGTTATVVDLVATAIASMEAISGITPVGFIAHPSVVSTIRQAKASTSGVYVADPLAKGPTTLHGVTVYSTPATAATTAWLVSGSPGVTVYRREQVTVEVGWNAADWSTNTKTARAEERVGVAVTRPSSLYKLTLS
jgi:HK97 family phage major capsid protein